jgi:hypothetical protein
VRRATNLPDKPGGDSLYINSAVVPLDQANAPKAPPTPAQQAAAIIAERQALRLATLRESIHATS